MAELDLVVVGSGLAGLFTALSAQRAGLRAVVVSKGEGTVLLSSGCVDLLGYVPGVSTEPVADPVRAIADLAALDPEHPYSKCGADSVGPALERFLSVTEAAGLSYRDGTGRNCWIPTAAGSCRPAALVPRSMQAGDMTPQGGGAGGATLIVGFSGMRDFYPQWVAKGLSETRGWEQHAFRSAWIQGNDWGGDGPVSPIGLARSLDEETRVRALATMVKGMLDGAGRVGFPAVLGMDRNRRCLDVLEAEVGVPVFEIPGLPPSVPGRRLAEALKQEILRGGGFVETGFSVVEARCDGRTLKSLGTAHKSYHARSFVLATGTFFGKGLVMDRRDVCEPILGLPVDAPWARGEGFSRTFLDPGGHPVGGAGIAVDQTLRPVDRTGGRLYENVWIVGDLLACHHPHRDKSGGGVALVSAHGAVQHILAWSGRKTE